MSNDQENQTEFGQNGEPDYAFSTIRSAQKTQQKPHPMGDWVTSAQSHITGPLWHALSEIADIALSIDDALIIKKVYTRAGLGQFDLAKNWTGRPLIDVLTSESREKFLGRIQSIKAGTQSHSKTQLKDFTRLADVIEVNHCDNATGEEFPVQYSLHAMNDGDELILVGRDLSVLADTQQQLISAHFVIEREREKHRGKDTQFRILLEAINEPIMYLSASTGFIVDANAAAAGIFGHEPSSLIGKELNSLISGDGQNNIMELLVARAITQETQPLPIQILGSDMRAFLTTKLFRAAGERMLLCKITRSDHEMAPAKDRDGLSILESMVETVPEAMLFCNAAGELICANDYFLDLVGAAHVLEVKGLRLSEFLQRGSIEAKILLDPSRHEKRIGTYHTTIKTRMGELTSVQISLVRINQHQEMTFGILIKPVGQLERESTPQSDQNTTNKEENLEAASNLVGRLSLKDIVSQTADVIEKVCIQTALELTDNNRVAAADMLSLSRQSLYVKLRKYSLL